MFEYHVIGGFQYRDGNFQVWLAIARRTQKSLIAMISALQNPWNTKGKTRVKYLGNILLIAGKIVTVWARSVAVTPFTMNIAKTLKLTKTWNEILLWTFKKRNFYTDEELLGL